MLIWIFGPVQKNTVHIHQQDVAAGLFSLEHAKVRWFLSVNEAYLPNEAFQNGLRTFRSITVDGQELEFSGGFADLHT